jgi:hypothetical protein
MRQAAKRLRRFQQLVSKVEIEMLEPRVLLSVTNPIGPPPLPDQPEPLQGVVGTPQSLDPQLLNDAYGFNAISYSIDGGTTIVPANGQGQTIAIVDAYGSPTIVQDLETFDSHWGLSNNDAEGNFALTVQKLATPAGQPVDTNAADQEGWAKETSLDVEWAHAVAPGAHILLVEAPIIQQLNADGSVNEVAVYDQIIDWMDADVYAASQTGVVDVSMSWGIDNSVVPDQAGDGFINPNLFDGYLVTPNGHLDNDGQAGGVTFLAASGDDGTLEWPAASENVISVGGEETDVGINGEVQHISNWADATGSSGGGSDIDYGSPGWHIPLVALDASPLTGVWVYDSTPDQFGDVGWGVVGGTSFACPAWAGLIAIIDQGLEYRGIASLTTDQALGLSPYDPQRLNQSTNPYGILGLEEAGIVGVGGAPNTPFMEPDGHTTYNDLDPLQNEPQPTSFPLWPVPNGPVPDIGVTPDDGNTGWGAPDGGAFDFVEDMVGDEVSANDAQNLVVPDTLLPQLNFTVEPVSVVAGGAVSVTLSAFNANGSVDAAFTGANGTVSLALVGAPGITLNGTTTMNATNGTVTFSGLSIDTDGTYQFIATSDDANSVDSSPFTISSAPRDELNFIDQPTSIWQYGSFTGPVVVGIEDQFGNVVTTDESTVTLSIESGPLGGSITGNTTAIASDGQATFTHLSFSVPGSYVLQATDGALSVNSNGYEVVPIPIPLRYTFNGAALSTPALLQERLRNASLYTSKGPPSASQAAAIEAALNNAQVLNYDSFVAAALVPVAPGTFAAAGSPVDGASSIATMQALDGGSSGDNKLLD